VPVGVPGSNTDRTRSSKSSIERLSETKCFSPWFLPTLQFMYNVWHVVYRIQWRNYLNLVFYLSVDEDHADRFEGTSSIVLSKDKTFHFRDEKCNFNPLDNKTDHAIRLCNSYWDSQSILHRSGLKRILLGLASQVAEKEDNVVVEDVRGTCWLTGRYVAMFTSIFSTVLSIWTKIRLYQRATVWQPGAASSARRQCTLLRQLSPPDNAEEEERISVTFM
jgi:hypothetical protein